MSGPQLDIDTRISISLAVGSYLRAVDRFDAASQAMTEACSELREQIDGPARFVVQVEYRHYLVTRDHEGNFEIEQIESL
jgi:hypothetical protein